MSAQELEARLGEILNDPGQMQAIFSLARSLGLSPPEGESIPAPPSAPPPPAPKPPESAADTANDMLAALLQRAGKLDRRQENLLNALKPFLKPARREKIDRAMQAARLSRLAGAALRANGQNDQSGGSAHV